jgi:hypothetical protein
MVASTVVTLVVSALPVTVTAPAVLVVFTALVSAWVIDTVVPPVVAIAPCVTAPVVVELTVIVLAGAVVAPTVIVPVVTPVFVMETVDPPSIVTAPAASVSPAVTAVVLAAVRVVPATAVDVKAVSPVHPEASTTTVEEPVITPESMFSTEAETGTVIAEALVMLNVSVPLTPSIESPVVHVWLPPVSVALKVSSPELPVKVLGAVVSEYVAPTIAGVKDVSLTVVEAVAPAAVTVRVSAPSVSVSALGVTEITAMPSTPTVVVPTNSPSSISAEVTPLTV